VTGGHRIPARTWHVPGDFSAAAFFLVAASIVPDSEVRLEGVGVNPSRSGLIDVLRAMNADIAVTNERMKGGEPIADVTVRSAPLQGATVDSFDDHRIAMAMGVAGLVADGSTTVTNAECARISFPAFWDELHRVATPA